MKTLALALSLLITFVSFTADASNELHKGKPEKNKEQKLKTAVDRQVNKHIFYPVQGEEKNLEGKADVMLQVMPHGDVNVVLILSGNPLVKKFIEKQVKKMKVDSKEVVAGEIFKYRFVFRAKE